MSEAKVTTDHDEIRQWAEERGGRPSRVKDTGGKGGPGILRLDFGDKDEGLEEISWDDFFKAFDDNELAFLHQDEAGGKGHKPSRFNKFIHRNSDKN